MLEMILSKYKFKQLDSYLEKLKPEIIEEEVEEYSRFIVLNEKIKNGFNLKVMITDIIKGENWISIYFEKDAIIYEKIEFVIFDKSENGYNRVINYDYFTLDNDIATTFNSVYTYFDDEYKSGWEKTRKVYFKDISSYAGKDNLSNLSDTIDDSNIEILYKKENNNVEEEPIITIVTLENVDKVKSL